MEAGGKNVSTKKMKMRKKQVQEAVFSLSLAPSLSSSHLEVAGGHRPGDGRLPDGSELEVVVGRGGLAGGDVVGAGGLGDGSLGGGTG